MRANRLLWLLWLVVAFIYALRGLVLVSTGQGTFENTESMLTASVLAKLYEMDGDDR